MEVRETWQLLTRTNVILLPLTAVTDSDACACLHVHTHVCGHHRTQIFLASGLLLARWSSNTAGTEMLSWGWTQASKVKVKLSFKDSSLNFPLEESHSHHCFRNSNMCSWQVICSCFHIQTHCTGYALLGGRHWLWSAEIALLHDAPQYVMKSVTLRFVWLLSLQSTQPTLANIKNKLFLKNLKSDTVSLQNFLILQH